MTLRLIVGDLETNGQARRAYQDVELIVHNVDPAADAGGQGVDLKPFEAAVLAAIAYHQPITRDGLGDLFGREITRDLIGRLHARGLIGTGPRSPRRGAPHTFVTTEHFLLAFGLESLQDLPDRELMEDAGLTPAAETPPRDLR